MPATGTQHCFGPPQGPRPSWPGNRMDMGDTADKRIRRLAATGLGLGITGLTLWTTLFGGLNEFLLRGGILWAGGIVVILLHPSPGGRWLGAVLDVVLAATFSVSIYWFLHLSEEL